MITIIVITMISVVIFLFSSSLAIEAIYPALKIRSVFSRTVGSWWNGICDGVGSSQENVRLRREVASLSLLRTENDCLIAENARLRAALEYKKKDVAKWCAAVVLSRGGGASGTEHMMRLDKGSSAGIKKGAIVVVPEGLVGRVRSTTPHTSDVTLITSPDVKVSCYLEAHQNVTGILSGGRNDLLFLEHINTATPIAPRQRVLTSGLGGVFPRGIHVGTLLYCESKDETRFGCVQPAVDFSTLEDVFVYCEK